MDAAEKISSLQLRIQEMELLVRQNEAKQKKFDVLERKLIGAHSIGELLSVLVHDFRNDFLIDCVTVAMVDPGYEVSKLLDFASGDRHGLESLFITLDSDAALSQTLGNEWVPYLGPMRAPAAELFGDALQTFASIAVLPLMRQGRSWAVSISQVPTAIVILPGREPISWRGSRPSQPCACRAHYRRRD
jgi:two-component system cell cycle response regulator